MGWLARIFSQPPVELVTFHRFLRGRFKYVRQDGEWDNGKVYSIWNINLPRAIIGDCDDWAATAVGYLGPNATYIEFYLPNGEYHAACLYKGWVSDCIAKEPYLLGDIKVKVVVAYSEIKRYGQPK